MRFLRGACALALLALVTTSSSAETWQVPAEQLAHKIATVTGPGAIEVDVTNRSSLDDAEVTAIRRRLLSELASLGVHFASTDQAAATVRVSLSENVQAYVWVAEIQQGTNQRSVLMVTAPRPGLHAADHAVAKLSISRALLWTDSNRILDVAILNAAPQHLVVLEQDMVLLLRQQDGRWQQEQSLAILHSHPWPRDMRGRVMLRRDHLFDIYLPGIVCRSTTSPPLGLNCRASDDPWPLGVDGSVNAFYASTRNFFTGALSPGIGKTGSAPPFYSGAALPRDKYVLWIFTGVDGQAHLLDGMTDQVIPKAGWNGDVASLRSGCGSGWQVIATVAEENEAGKVKAFELPDREPVSATPAIRLGDDVTALWPGSDGESVIAIAQNFETANYEAYRLYISCGQ